MKGFVPNGQGDEEEEGRLQPMDKSLSRLSFSLQNKKVRDGNMNPYVQYIEAQGNLVAIKDLRSVFGILSEPLSASYSY